MARVPHVRACTQAVHMTLRRCDGDELISTIKHKKESDDMSLSFITYVWQGTRQAFGQKPKTFTCIDLCATYNDDKMDNIDHKIRELFEDFPRFIDEALEEHKHSEKGFQYEVFAIKSGTLRRNSLEKTEEMYISEEEEQEEHKSFRYE